MLEHPAELGAFILRGPGGVRVHASSMDRVGQKIRSEVIAVVRADVARGFPSVAHLHNHPFLFDRRVGDRLWKTLDTIDHVAGALAPSLSAVQFARETAKELPLRAVRNTNGFTSVRIAAEEVPRLASHRAP